ncbi:site-specific DNA-methyltransferase [Succinimonas sp.]|uniref:site-specific DNA-methyltransferase n=1 Tax=Succinimonas sp. TaxID=1936151 RepID=UPI003863CBF1
MTNLSKIKRDNLLSKIEILKNNLKDPTDAESLNTISMLKNELTNKKYGLVWEEHSENVDEMLKDNIPVFTEDKSREIISDESLPYNFLLEGDNLHSLKLLEKTHKGKIDVIYIDPPYNLGNKDFIYDDNYVDKNDAYRHSKWISFIFERLIIAKQLLKDDGIILISIDSTEGFQLKLLLDSIFGEKNFVADFHIETSYVAGTRRFAAINGSVVKTTEFVLGYSRNINSKPIKNPKYDYIMGFDKHYNLFLNTETNQTQSLVQVIEQNKTISNIFKQYEMKISLDNLGKMVLCNDTVREWLYSDEISDNLYRLSSDEVLIKDDNYNIPDDTIFTYNGKYVYKSDSKLLTVFKYSDRLGCCDDYHRNYGERSIRGNLWKGFSADGGNLINEGGVSFKNGKKPIRLIQQLLDTVLSTNNSHPIILDFFAGSGTTGEVVLTLKNKYPKISFILCTNNENNICKDITYQRIKNVITGTKKNGAPYTYKIPANLKYFKTDFVPKDSDNIQDVLLEHVAEMIELENGIKLDGRRYIMILDDEQADNLSSHWKEYSDVKALYVARDVLFNTEQNMLFKDIEIHTIPDYYFNFELREAGELW